MKIRFRGFKLLISVFIFLSIFTFANNDPIEVSAAELKTIEYVAKEDAYVRSSKAGTNYNYEDITRAHGQQYEGKGYRVINSKYNGSDEIMAVMKFDLPTAKEIKDYKLDLFELEFNIFKNAGYTNPKQEYGFYYTTDTSWSEKTLTWNNKPAVLSRDNPNQLFTFVTEQNDEYEKKKDLDKRITKDITSTIKKLVEEGHSQITIYATGKEKSNTSLLLHCKETSVESKRPKLIASNEKIDLDDLKDLVSEVSGVKKEEHTTQSYEFFEDSLLAANELINNNSDLITIRSTYRILKKAYEGLEKLVTDTDNIAYQKPARSNLSKKLVGNVNDGDKSTSWSGIFYPSYVDIDLLDTYDLEKIKIYVPVGKKAYYTLYGSNDGKNYDRIYQTREGKEATADGDEITFKTPIAYRIIRIYMEFTDGDKQAYLSEVEAYGKKTDSNTKELREGTFEEILDVKAFDETDYNKPISDQETIENVYGIIDRTIGAEYRSWFSFEIADKDNEKDYFELSDVGEKIHIKANEGLSLTTGLNYYFKNYVNVHISEQTMQINMPEKLVPIGEKIRKETSYQIRYAYNYCTLSYTFAFFGEEEWQRENDWLALNGVNVVLDLAGQEATWIKFLMNYGYSYDDAKDWLTGPAYYAWQFMDNMETFGGPVPDGYVKDRLELARSTQRWKRSLGMQTVLQGYAGMVPTNFNEYQPDVKVTKQGSWGGFSRPDMIATNSDEYDRFSKKFYEAQEFVYGATSDYYAVDPYHEGGIRPPGLTDDIVAKEVLESLLEYNKDAVWIVQGWQSNPTNNMLKGMGEHRNDHVLIVDLVKYPLKSWTKYNKIKYGSTTLDSVEFNGTDWAWCLLGNFGGNPTMNGQMQVMVDDILNAQKTSKHMKGIGIISEGTYDNPILYDLIFDLAWADQDFNLNQWMNNYIQRRYGAVTENTRLAWQTMKDSNYNHGVRHTNELFGMKSKAPQDYGTQDIPYGADKLETAFKLLIEDYDKFKNNECYRYDLREIMRQVVSNYAVITYNEVLDAKNKNSLENFKGAKAKFLKAFDVLNEVQAIDKDQMAGEWIGRASDLAENYDDFAKDSFEMNAKALITTWGSKASSGLKEYGWRNYEGMFLDIYKRIWSDYLDKVEQNLEHGTPIQTIKASGYFNFTWNWVVNDQDYSRDPKNSPEEVKEIIDLVVKNCSLTEGLSPNAGNLALNKIANTNTKKTTGRTSFVTDGEEDTTFTATAFKQGDEIKKPEIRVDLMAEFQLSKVNLLFDTTDTIYQYEVYASFDGEKWKKVGEKKSNDLHPETGDVITIEDMIARYVKVIGIKDSKHLNNEANTEIKVKEFRVYGERILPELSQLSNLIKAIEDLKLNANSNAQLEQLQVLLEDAKKAVEREAPPDEINTIYWGLYDYVESLDLSGLENVALSKPVTAHNDPSGYSKRINDGDNETSWDSGRLSPPGKPYEHDPITPGWAIIDLEKGYDISELRLTFGSTSLWYNYEIYGSIDGKDDSWTKLGEKTTQNIPNKKEDFHYIDARNIRYIKLVSTNIKTQTDGRRASFAVRELAAYGLLHKDVIRNNLQNLIDDVSMLKEEDYTSTSWKVFSNALAIANKIIDKEDATEADIISATDNLRNAIDGLVEVGSEEANKIALKIAIEAAKHASLENVIPVVVKEFNEALDKAMVINDKANATQEEVNKAFDRLAKAMHMLEFFKGDKKVLNEFIIKVKDLKEFEYTEGTWKTFQAALATATRVNEDVNAMEEEVNQTYTKLVKAFVNLRYKPNKDLLAELINNAEGLNAENYSVDSWARVASALKEARTVLDNPEATEAEVNKTNDILTKALLGLVTKPSNPLDSSTPVKPSVTGGKEGAAKTGDTTSMIYPLSGLTVTLVVFYGIKKRKKLNK